MNKFLISNKTIPMVMGVLTAVIGFIVLWGWHTSNPTLTQFGSIFAAMQYNAALCFVAAGVGIISLANDDRLLPFLLGIFIMLIGYLTLVEYLFNLNIGLDQLFMSVPTSNSVNSPGRMYPTTTLMLSLIGTSLFILSNYTNAKSGSNRSYFLLIILNLIIVMTSFSALFSYIVDLPKSYGWGVNEKIVLHSAFSTFILSIGLIGLVYKKASANNVSFANWLPWLVFFGAEVLTLSFWQASSAYVEKNVTEQTLVAANGIKSIVREELEARTEALARMAKRWEGRKGGTPHHEWVEDAANIIKDQPGYQSIEWVDLNFRVKWVEPLKGNEGTLSFNVLKKGSATQALKKALNKGETTVSPMVTLISGDKGFLIYSPIGKGKKLQGVIIGVINAKLFFEEVLYDAIKNYNIAIYFGNEILYQLHAANNSTHKHSAINYVVNDNNWSVASWPLPEQAKKLHSWLPVSILIIGFVVGLLLSLIIYLAQIARRNVQKAQEEIKTRERAEQKLIVYSKKLKKLSVSDALTGTNNRRGLNTILQSEIDNLKASQNNLSVILLDIDHFKKINDTYGHVIGDKVLQRVSEILKKNIRSSDVIARYGGEEFCIVLNNTSDTQAYTVAEKLRNLIATEAFYSENKKPFKLTCSFGVYQVPKGVKKINDVFEVVDSALYTAKNSGRNCVILV